MAIAWCVFFPIDYDIAIIGTPLPFERIRQEKRAYSCTVDRNETITETITLDGLRLVKEHGKFSN